MYFAQVYNAFITVENYGISFGFMWFGSENAKKYHINTQMAKLKKVQKSADEREHVFNILVIAEEYSISFGFKYAIKVPQKYFFKQKNAVTVLPLGGLVQKSTKYVPDIFVIAEKFGISLVSMRFGFKYGKKYQTRSSYFLKTEECGVSTASRWFCFKDAKMYQKAQFQKNQTRV